MTTLVLYTGPGGADLYEESMEKQGGLTRIYVGRKVPRILRRVVKHIRKSHSGRYYYLQGKKMPSLGELLAGEDMSQYRGKYKELDKSTIEAAISDLFYGK